LSHGHLLWNYETRINRMMDCVDSTEWRILNLYSREYCHYYRKTLGAKEYYKVYLVIEKLVTMTETELKLDLDRMGANSPEFLSSHTHTHTVYFSSLPIPFDCSALYACRVFVRNSRIYSFLTRVYWHITNYKWNGVFDEFEVFSLWLCSNSFPLPCLWLIIKGINVGSM